MIYDDLTDFDRSAFILDKDGNPFVHLSMVYYLFGGYTTEIDKKIDDVKPDLNGSVHIPSKVFQELLLHFALDSTIPKAGAAKELLREILPIGVDTFIRKCSDKDYVDTTYEEEYMVDYIAYLEESVEALQRVSTAATHLAVKASKLYERHANLVKEEE